MAPMFVGFVVLWNGEFNAESSVEIARTYKWSLPLWPAFVLSFEVNISYMQLVRKKSQLKEQFYFCTFCTTFVPFFVLLYYFSLILNLSIVNRRLCGAFIIQVHVNELLL